MKTFLACWLTETPGIFKQQFARECNLLPCAKLPQPETAVSFAISFGMASGCFLVSADRASLKALLTANGVIVSDEDEQHHFEVWRAILQQTAESAVRLLNPAFTPNGVSIEAAGWTLGRPSAAYELHCGENAVLLAFTDELEQMELISEGTEHGPAFLPADSAKVAPEGIDLLLDVELEASIRFGSREMPLSEVLDLGAGDVVELDRQVSDPVDLLVGDKIVARGEVVLVNGSFGLRVLEVAEPRKCLESIRCLF